MKKSRKNNDYLLSFEETKAKYFSDKPKFDFEQYEKNHLKSLLETAENDFKNIETCYLPNLKRTVKHWLEVNKIKHVYFEEGYKDFDCSNYNEYKALEAFYINNLKTIL